MAETGKGAASWSDELDALRFSVPGHGASCAVHRLAFKALLAEPPHRDACLHYFEENSDAFLNAALAKIARLALPSDRSLHLNSRDLRRANGADDASGPSRSCHVLDRASSDARPKTP